MHTCRYTYTVPNDLTLNEFLHDEETKVFFRDREFVKTLSYKATLLGGLISRAEAIANSESWVPAGDDDLTVATEEQLDGFAFRAIGCILGVDLALKARICTKVTQLAAAEPIGDLFPMGVAGAGNDPGVWIRVQAMLLKLLDCALAIEVDAEHSSITRPQTQSDGLDAGELEDLLN